MTSSRGLPARSRPPGRARVMAAAASSAALATPSSRASAAALAAQLVASATPGRGSSAALNDATDILCASFPLLDPPVVRSVVAQHAPDAAALLAALCELAGETPPSRAQLPAAGWCVATRHSAARANAEPLTPSLPGLRYFSAERARAAQAEAAAEAEAFDAELSLALALSVSEHEYATRGGAYAPQPPPQQRTWLPPPPQARAQAPSRPLPPLPLQTWHAQPPVAPPPRHYDAAACGGRGGGGGRGRGRGRGSSRTPFPLQQRPFEPYFPRDACASRGWMAAWLPDGSARHMPPPPPPQRVLSPTPLPLPSPEVATWLPPTPLAVASEAVYPPPPPPPPPPPMWVQEPPVPLPLPIACDGPSTASALLRELFPDLPLDMESLVATLGPEEATRVCFEIMGGCDLDGSPANDSGEGDRWGLENDMDITEQLGVLQGYFPDAPLEALFERLSVAGSLDGAIAACMQEESVAQASAEQQAAQAASAPPTGKEKEKVSALRHAYPGLEKELLLSVLRAAHGSHRGAVAKLEQMGLDGSSVTAPSAMNGTAAAGGRGRAGRFAAATAAAASAPPRRGGFGGSGERREWRGRFSTSDSGPTYSELRREASTHYDAMRRAIVAAGHAAELGDRAMAARHQAAAREAKALAEKSNAAASAVTLATRNAANHGRVTRDLHALHVAEAVAEVQRWIGFVATAHSGGSMTLQFVTGRGAHSAQGAKLLPAIEEYLESRGIPWALTNGGGCVEVTVDENLRQALLTHANAAAPQPYAAGAFVDAAPGPVRYEDIKRRGDF